jgi:hypothetical protein
MLESETMNNTKYLSLRIAYAVYTMFVLGGAIIAFQGMIFGQVNNQGRAGSTVSLIIILAGAVVFLYGGYKADQLTEIFNDPPKTGSSLKRGRNGQFISKR